MLVLQPAKGFFNDAGHFVQVIQNPAAHRKFLNRMRPLRDLFDKPNPLTTERMYWAVPANECGEVLNKIYTVKQQFPDSAIQRPDAEHLPADIDQELDELVQVLHVSPRLTTIACRRILEKACKTKLKNAFSPKKPLRELIDAALTALETTRQISDWAHQLRILGNEAVHESDEPITADEAQQAYDLTRLMLDLLFAYPVKIAALRNESV
ncbi:conserved hypothetical protein [Candidatus Glomeribacter gigasporarum BEG34]|uniref:DUF4145 domain-containing protein n=2 Tax=Candidatus Glomeribacter gigasporarum TaxID=132144 RepID=G2J7E5_9BURK|nr:conserved hypothetical protein [Candidatus Glomeribacter gigasporarum BEG34]